MTTILELYVYKADAKQMVVAGKIAQAWRDEINKHCEEPMILEHKIIDVSSYGEVVTTHPALIFGSLALPYVLHTPGAPRFLLPDLSQLFFTAGNKTPRTHAFETLKEAGKVVAELSSAPPPEEKQYIYVQLEDGTTVGHNNTDIQITQSEVEYWKQVKDLLPGSAVILKKGDKEARMQYD